jgi:hypothetical protein
MKSASALLLSIPVVSCLVTAALNENPLRVEAVLAGFVCLAIMLAIAIILERLS